MTQGEVQASLRAATGKAFDYNGDWHAAFDLAGIPAGHINGRMLAWINAKLGTSYDNLPGAQAAFAAANGATNFSSLGTFSAAAPVTWTPAQLFTGSQKGGWWDGADASSMFQNSGGTGAVAVGDPVGRWSDKSGKGNHLLQTAAANRPVRDANFGILMNNASVNHLACLMGVAMTSTQLHVVVALRVNAWTASENRVLSMGQQFTGDQGATFSTPVNRELTNNALTNKRNNVTSPAVAVTLGTKYRVEALDDGANGNIRVGSTVGANTARTGAFNILYFELGKEINSGGASNISVADLVIRDSAITGSDLTSLRSYLDTKWTL